MGNAVYPKFKAWRANGTSLASGYLLYTYESGTTTPKTTYSNASLVTPQANPIVLDSVGEANIFLGEGSYRFDLKTPAGALVWTFDPVIGSSVSTQVVNTINDLLSLSPNGQNLVQVLGYLTVGDGAGGSFYWDADDSIPADGGLTFTPNSAPAIGRWKRVHGKEIKTSWFGTTAGFFTALVGGFASTAEILVDSTIALTEDTEIPTNVSIRDGGGEFNLGNFDLTPVGPFLWGRRLAFNYTGTGVVIWGDASHTTSLFPEWYGAGALGATDDSDALERCFEAGINQYRGIGTDLGSGQFAFSRTLTIRKRVTGNGFRLLPQGDGSGFVAANYDATTAPSKVDCCIVIQDGGVLEGGSINVTDANFDAVANAGKWLINVEGCFGKNPLYNMRINGRSASMQLGGVIVRYCTTCHIGPFGGSHLLNGFKIDACNQITMDGVFFEFINRGGNPFLFTNSSHVTVESCWTEGCRNNTIGFYFNGVNNYRIRNLQVSETHGGEYLTGTSDLSSDTITQDADAPMLDDDQIRFDTAPGGLNTTSFYYVVNAGASTFQVALTSGGAAINITTSVAVQWRNAMQNAVRFTNCSKMIAEALKYEAGTAFISGTTIINGSSSQLLIDDTYETVASSYGDLTEMRYDDPRDIVIENIDLDDTTVRRRVGRFLGGTQLTIRITAKTSGLASTDGSIELYKLTGAGYSLKGTITVGSGDLTSIGNVTTATFNLDAHESIYLSPVAPAGSGVIDVEVTWNQVSGL